MQLDSWSGSVSWTEHGYLSAASDGQPCRLCVTRSEFAITDKTTW